MATLNLDEILNYINPEPKYAGKLEDLGLLEAGDLEAARKQSVFQGLLGAGLGYLAQPKNQGYGSILPYFAKAGMQGLQASKAPYEQLTQDALMNQKLKEVEYQRGERKYQNDQRALAANKLAKRNKILGEGLFETVLTDRPNLPIAPEQLTLPSGEQSVRPMFGTTPQAPTVSQEINFDTINKLIQAGELGDAGTGFNIAKQFKDLKNPKLKSKTVGDYLIFTDDFGNMVSKTKVGDPKVVETERIRKTMKSDGTVMETPYIEIKVDGKIIGSRDIVGVESVRRNELSSAKIPKSETKKGAKTNIKDLVKALYPNQNINFSTGQELLVANEASKYQEEQAGLGNIISRNEAIKSVLDPMLVSDTGMFGSDFGDPDFKVVAPTSKEDNNIVIIKGVKYKELPNGKFVKVNS